MKVTVKLPKVADSVDEVAVIGIPTAVGQTVAAGDTMLTVETDKTSVDVPTPVGGTVRDVLVAVDDEITAGTPVIVVDTD